MKSFLVLTPPGGEAERDPDKALILADGFSAVAFVFPSIWLLARRLWLAGGVVLALQIAGIVLCVLPGLAPAGILSLLALHVLVALEARHYRSEALLRRGFTLAAVIPAADIATAEEIWFSSLPAPVPQPIPAVREWAKRAGQVAAGWQQPPLGLFDQQEGR